MKPVFIDPGIGGQIGDQADVGAFGGLDGAHTAIVAVVHVADLETRRGHGKDRRGPRADIRRLCVSSASGFVWSMNWLRGLEPKNSL